MVGISLILTLLAMNITGINAWGILKVILSLPTLLFFPGLILLRMIRWPSSSIVELLVASFILSYVVTAFLSLLVISLPLDLSIKKLILLLTVALEFIVYMGSLLSSSNEPLISKKSSDIKISKYELLTLIGLILFNSFSVLLIYPNIIKYGNLDLNRHYEAGISLWKLQLPYHAYPPLYEVFLGALISISEPSSDAILKTLIVLWTSILWPATLYILIKEAVRSLNKNDLDIIVTFIVNFSVFSWGFAGIDFTIDIAERLLYGLEITQITADNIINVLNAIKESIYYDTLVNTHFAFLRYEAIFSDLRVFGLILYAFTIWMVLRINSGEITQKEPVKMDAKYLFILGLTISALYLTHIFESIIITALCLQIIFLGFSTSFLKGIRYIVLCLIGTAFLNVMCMVLLNPYRGARFHFTMYSLFLSTLAFLLAIAPSFHKIFSKMFSKVSNITGLLCDKLIISQDFVNILKDSAVLVYIILVVLSLISIRSHTQLVLEDGSIRILLYPYVLGLDGLLTLIQLTEKGSRGSYYLIFLALMSFITAKTITISKSYFHYEFYEWKLLWAVKLPLGILGFSYFLRKLSNLLIRRRFYFKIAVILLIICCVAPTLIRTLPSLVIYLQ